MVNKETTIVVLKRIIASIGIILAWLVLGRGTSEFGRADEWIEIFKALFWIIVGGFALWSFIDDFKEKKWPLED